MRLYVPATRAALAAWWQAGGVSGHEEPFVADGDDEESEYAALSAAAEASAALGPADGRRVVLVAEVAREEPVIALRDVVAVHADLAGDRPRDDLGWFATQEVPALLEG